jgi:hypothetical protein
VFYCTTPASINSIIKQPLINIFPNPTNSELRLELSQFMVGGLYQIFDYKGILYNSGQVVNDKFIIDVSQLQNGLYIIRFEETNLKFIKE